MSEYCHSQQPVVHIAIFFFNQTRSGSLDNYTLSCECNMCAFVELCAFAITCKNRVFMKKIKLND